METRKTFEPLLFTHSSLSAFKQGHLFSASSSAARAKIG